MSSRISVCAARVSSPIAPRSSRERPSWSGSSCASAFSAVRVCSSVENSAWDTESCRSRAIRWRSCAACSPSRRLASASCRGRPLALADRGGEEQRRHRRHDDVDLRAQGPVVDRLLEERPDIVGGDADRHARRDRDRQRGARSPEPGRRPDQRREDDIGHGLAAWTRRARRASRRWRSAGRPRRSAAAATRRAGSLAHASTRGTTTNAPATSPSHHVRQNVGASPAMMTPPASIETIPTVALIAVATARAANSAADLLGAIDRRARADEPPQQQGAHDDLGHVARLLAEQAPERQRDGSEEQLPVDDELRDEDPGPPAQAPQVERRDAEPGRRPDRGRPRPCSAASGPASPSRSKRPRGAGRRRGTGSTGRRTPANARPSVD